MRLKNNLLAKVSVRIDYSGVANIETYLEEINNVMEKYSFITMYNSYINSSEFNVNDPVKLDLSMFDRCKSFCFEDAKGSKIIINEFIVILEIIPGRDNLFKSTMKYVDIVTELLSIVKKYNKFLEIKRAGIRKINSCILINTLLLDKYFSSVHLKKFNMGDIEYISSQNLDCLFIENNVFNYINDLTVGELYNKKAYQITIDIDGYIHSDIIERKITKSVEKITTNLKKINKQIFLLFKSSLTSSFISKLKDEEYIWDNNKDIMGVKPNEI